MSYVDSSRVQIAIRFAQIAAGSAAERSAATEDLRVFLDALWADATADGRSRYMMAAARVSGGLPWAAVTVPAGPAPRVGEEPALAGPAVVELIAGQADPDDEGVAGYRLEEGDPRAAATLGALYGWDVGHLERAIAPGGWRLEEAEAATPRAPEEMDDAPGEPHGEAASEPGGATGGSGEVSEAPAPTPFPWGRVAMAAGGVATVIGLALWGRTTEGE